MTELAVVFLNVAGPNFLAGKIKTFKNAGSGHDPNVFAIGYGDGEDMFCLRIFTLPLPSNFFQSVVPFVRSTHQRYSSSFSATLRKIRSRQMIGVDPLHSASPISRRRFPRRPLEWQVLLGADAVKRGPAPLRPVLGRSRCQRQCCHNKNERDYTTHILTSL